MGRYNDELKQVGVLLDLAGLLPSAEGRRVKFSGGNRAVIGGPFAESKELLAGYWILQVEFDGRGCGMGRAVPVRGVVFDLSGRVWRRRRDRDPSGVRAGS
jgi:YCII-related domain